jgi:hypothetical protein
MNWFEKNWQRFTDTIQNLAKTTDPDIPVRWKCCDELVAPNDLAQHYKEKHLHDGRGMTREQYVDLILHFAFLLSTLFILGLKY